jgi:hypothetical protein
MRKRIASIGSGISSFKPIKHFIVIDELDLATLDTIQGVLHLATKPSVMSRLGLEMAIHTGLASSRVLHSHSSRSSSCSSLNSV